MSDPASQFAFLFTDIETSSAKWLRFGDNMHAALARHDDILRASIENNGGIVFKTAGDAFYGAFSGPSQALDAALDAQRRIAATEWDDVGGLAVRMAVHHGPALERDGDYFGPALNRCARLLALAYGEQILLSRSTAEALEGEDDDLSFPQIGISPLDDPDVEEPIHQVVAEDLRQTFPPLPDPRAVPNNLPQSLPSIVGRAEEIEAILAALGRSRWVTLTGIGGVGKTRLALEVAAILANARRGGETAKLIRKTIKDGIWLVELANVSDSKLIPAAVAAAMDIELTGSRPPVAELLDRLKSKAALLLLDNCEHLLGGAAQFGSALLAACPRILVLATSQDLAGVVEESAIAVAELPLPPESATTAESVLESPAVQLFVERAASAEPGFRLTDRDAPAAGRISRTLDGIALAIEMAAARVPMFGVAALADRLDNRFRELAGSDDQRPERHQTLRAAIDWSHGLLTKRDKLVLRRAGAFAGSFSTDDAVAVIADDYVEEIDVLNALAELVRRSLMVRDRSRLDPRYRLLQTVLAYARDKLGDAAEAEPTELRHLRRMQVVAEDAYARALDIPDAVLRESYEPDLPNIRAALDRGFAGSDVPGAMKIAGSVQPLFAASGLLAEVRERLDQATTHTTSVDQASAARVWLGLGLALGFSHPARACEMLEKAELFYRSDPGSELAQLLVMNGRLSQVVAGREAKSRALLAEAGPLVEATGAKRLLGHLYRGLGNQLMAEGDSAQAVAMMRRSQQAFEEAGADAAAMTVSTSLGYVLWASGDLDAAIAQCRDVLGRLRAEPFIDPTVLGFVLGNLAGMLTERGDLEEAASVFVEAAPLLRDPWQIWVIFDHVARFHAAAGALENAARASGFTNLSYREHATARQPNEARAHAFVSEMLNGELPPERLAQLEAEGASMSRDQAIELAVSASQLTTANS